MPKYKVWREDWNANSRQEDEIEADSLKNAEAYAENWATEDLLWSAEEIEDGFFSITRSSWMQHDDYDEIELDSLEDAEEYAEEWTKQDVDYGAKEVKNNT